jgi:FdhD protein
MRKVAGPLFAWPAALKMILGFLCLAFLAGIISLAVQKRQSDLEEVRVATAMTGGDPKTGLTAMERHGCGACHEVPGLARADGRVGPSLDKVATRAFIAGTLPNQPAAMAQFVARPQHVQPQGGMPDLPRHARRGKGHRRLSLYVALMDALSLPQAGARVLPVVQVSDGQTASAARWTPDEVAVALVHDAGTTAVMMATPWDIEDLAIGFSLTEGIIDAASEIARLEVVVTELGLEARMWLVAARSARLAQRRRTLAGPTGCGLCGVDSLKAAARGLPKVRGGLRLTADDIQEGLDALSSAQDLGRATRAAHAAAWWTPGTGLVHVREDVGRHNALDKLAGALAVDPDEAFCAPGAVFLTSRVSIEMVQKAVMIGAQAIVAISAPTALAVEAAERAGVTLVAIARNDGFMIFSHAERLVDHGGNLGSRL